MDYVYQDGKAVESIRLPGYAGASGLDADQQALRDLKEQEEMDSQHGHDLESVRPPAFFCCHALLQQQALHLV